MLYFGIDIPYTLDSYSVVVVYIPYHFSYMHCMYIVMAMAMAIFFSLTEPRWTCFYCFILFKNNKKKKEKFFQHAYMF